MAAVEAAGRLAFPGLHPRAFEHPLDRAALEALRKTAGLDLLFKKLASLRFERIVRLQFTGNGVQLTPRQLPRVYALLRDAAAVLDLPEPDLYLLQTPEATSTAVGMERHTIVLTSGLLDLLNEDELRAAIGKEMGHIKSGHMLYRTIALFLHEVGRAAVKNLPLVGLLSDVLRYTFYDWMQKSELTADRAALLVAQDVDVAMRLKLKLAGGATRYGELDVTEFIKQADDYDDMDSSVLDQFYKFEITSFKPHPLASVRAREIQRWVQSGDYGRILAGDYPREEDAEDLRRCRRCGALVENPVFRYCPDCGEAL